MVPIMKYDEIKTAILKSQKEFESLLHKIEVEKDIIKKQKFAKRAIVYASEGSTGYYSSDIIEKVFIDIGQQQTIDRLPDYQPNTVLHVMTQGYEVGGHTRVVERWVELSSHNQKQSVLFTASENQKVPERLENAIKNKAGEIIKLSDQFSDLEKGLRLREIASNYQFVILHIHPNDVVPLIAFSHKQFQRPVIFFNHADHRFWLGVSISDLVVDLRRWGEKLSINKRGVINNFILSIPVDNKKVDIIQDKFLLRKKLNLPLDKKIVITVGSPHKYKPVANFNFLNITKKILDKHPNIIFIFIGPNQSTFADWQSVSSFDERVLALGHKLPEEMFDYLIASDLALDSFPMCGSTALIDAITCNNPVLSLKCPTGHLDYVMDSVAYCPNEQILLEKIDNILSSEQLAQRNIKDVSQKLKKNNSVENWQRRLAELYQRMDKVIHTITPFKPINYNQIEDIDIYLYSEARKIKKKWSIPKLVNFYRVKISGVRYTEIVILDRFTVKISGFRLL